ncbi:MAG TPA: hypothetical protein VHE09_00555, partial [Rhizomicrobium sp.]|nr:hypothetical protein [Rhizomicrobium sp.]
MNFLVCSALKGDAQERQRLETLLSGLNKRKHFLKAPAPKETENSKSGDDELLAQARGISTYLLDDPPVLSSVSLSEFAAHEKETKRKARAAKKSSRREGDDVSASSASEGKPTRKSTAAAGPENDALEGEPAEGRADAKRQKREANKTARAQKRSASKKEDKENKAEKTPAGPDKAARIAERKKRKAEKAASAGADSGKPEKEDRAAKKARKAANKESGAGAEPDAPEDRNKARAERKARKAAKAGLAGEGAAAGEKRKKQRPEPQSEEEKLEREKARAARKEERKKHRPDGETDGEEDKSRVLTISLRGIGVSAANALRAALEQRLDATPVEWPQSEKKADITIYGFDDPKLSAAEISDQGAKIAQDTTRLRIFLERRGSVAPDAPAAIADENRAVAALAGAFESPFISLEDKVQRYGAETVPASDILATAILGVAAGGRLPKYKVPRPAPPPPPDLVEARALAATPREFLEQLTWNDAKAPRLLWTHASKESAEALMDRRLTLSEDQTLDITVPVKWPDDASSRSETADLFGLEFLSGPLNYWYSKANGRESKKVAEVDAVLKARGATASQILSQAGAIIMDFVTTHPLSASIAWEENAVSRRSRVLALYLLCCKMAIKRKIKFDESVCSEVILRLLDHVEVLRSDDFYTPCSFDGVQQDCLVTGLALVLRDTAYAKRLLAESLGRLLSCQLGPGLTADGVWRMGSFSDHCTLLSQFRTLLSDFDRDDVAMLEPIAGAAKKMTVFAEAMQKSDGSAPSFDDSRQKSFARKLTGTRRALAGAGFAKSAPQRKVVPPRMTDTYVFRDARYFVSHSTLKVIPESSLVVLHADPVSPARSDPGGVTLAFAYGATDLLVRAEPGEGASRRDKAASFDPALRNGYRINGAGYVADAPLNPNGARIEKSWRGQGWAAARSMDETNPAGSIARTVIHLKAEHVLVVVDELAAASNQEATFEQHWHIAPGLAAPSSGQASHRFALSGGGGLTVAFGEQADVTINPEGEGSCLCRTL